MTSFLSNLVKYDFIKYLSLFLSYGYFYLIPIFLFFWIFISKTKKIHVFLILFLSTFSTWILSEVIKVFTKIERPDVLSQIVHESTFSFPSTHSAVSMVLGVVTYSLNKKLGIILIISSFIIGVSRIILGVHYFVDVFVGWFLGFVVALIFIRFFKKS